MRPNNLALTLGAELRFASVLACVVALACGGEESTAPSDPYAAAAGTYTLVSLNGRALPTVLFQDATIRMDLSSATLVMRADRTFTETLDGTITEGSAQPVAEHQVHDGTFTLSGGAAVFTIPAANGFPAFGFSGTLSGNVLTYTDETASYRYERR